MLLPVLIAYIYAEDDLLPSLAAASITGAIGLILMVTCRSKGELRLREGFALVTLTWLSFAFLGALPFYISGHIPSYTDAFFETMSGFTTTGASILTNIEVMPHGLLFWRSFTHWIGGMGIILLSLAILPLLGVGGMQLYKAEVPGPEHDKLSPRIKDTAKILWEVYILISVIEMLLLYLAGMNLFDAICHTFGTMATGGFSTKNASVGYYNSALIDYIIIIFMIIAGINFSLHYKGLRGKVSSYWRDPETKFFFFLIFAGTFIIVAELYVSYNYTMFEGIQKGLFQAVSIITTTGYGTDDYEKWGSSSQMVLFLFMFFGGCAGSTGGAIKIMRSLVMVKFAFNEIKRLIHPNAVLPIRIGDRTIPREIVANITGFFLIYIGIFVLGVVFMTLIGLDFVSSLGAVAATIGNIGPGLGSVGPTDNFAQIPAAGKWVLSFLMLVGRLEIYPVIIFLSPTFWKK
ncbi:MAG: TrkH family potassium uptake protein [Calditrichales bacterium]|nr:MAG: TrkH family potassium uptake protein [Calditrichales bacterium]